MSNPRYKLQFYVDPNLTTCIPDTFHSTQPIRTTKQSSKSDSDMNGKVSRGANWDSKLLINTMYFITETSICTDYQKIVLTLVGKAKYVKDQRMMDYFNTLNLKFEEHSLTSFSSH